jgi:hypothetical protein
MRRTEQKASRWRMPSKYDAPPSCEFEGPDAAKEVEETYPLIDESFREDWEAPGMDDYDSPLRIR